MRFGFDDFRPVFFDERFHFLFAGHGECATFFGFGLCDAKVGRGLFRCEFRTDVLAGFQVRNVDRHDLERGLRVEARVQHSLRNDARIREDFAVIDRRADRLDDTFADAGDDRFFGGTADEAFEFRSHRDAGFGQQLNAVLADRVEELLALGRIGAVDDFRIDAGANGFENIAASEVDGGGGFPREFEAGFVCGNDGGGGLRHVAARQEVRFEVRRRHLHARLHERDLLANDQAVIDVPQLHADQATDADVRPGEQALNPEANEAHEDKRKDDEDQDGNRAHHDHNRLHVDFGRLLSEQNSGHEAHGSGPFAVVGHRMV